MLLCCYFLCTSLSNDNCMIVYNLIKKKTKILSKTNLLNHSWEKCQIWVNFSQIRTSPTHIWVNGEITHYLTFVSNSTLGKSVFDTIWVNFDDNLKSKWFPALDIDKGMLDRESSTISKPDSNSKILSLIFFCLFVHVR